MQTPGRVKPPRVEVSTLSRLPDAGPPPLPGGDLDAPYTSEAIKKKVGIQ